jgi:hypothetical protein
MKLDIILLAIICLEFCRITSAVLSSAWSVMVHVSFLQLGPTRGLCVAWSLAAMSWMVVAVREMPGPGKRATATPCCSAAVGLVCSSDKWRRQPRRPRSGQ